MWDFYLAMRQRGRMRQPPRVTQLPLALDNHIFPIIHTGECFSSAIERFLANGEKGLIHAHW
jgi:hypothetical protein